VVAVIFYIYIPISNIKITERGKIDNPYTQIHECSLTWLGTFSSKKRGGVKKSLKMDQAKICQRGKPKGLNMIRPKYVREGNQRV
jgi:hypothetical protein